MIGHRLKLARAASGLSLRELAGKIDNKVTAQAIGKYERDEMMPGSAALIALSHALQVPVDYLLGEPELALDSVEFRKKAVTRRRDEAQIEAAVIQRLERYLAVEEALGLRSAEWERPRDAPYPVASVAEADRTAQFLRQAWSLGADPIPNIVELLEERGIKVLVLNLENVDGLKAQVRRPNHQPMPVIVVNRGVWGERQRFTLAHELGHMVMDLAPGVDAEKAADRFAGAFLMPAEALWSEIGRHRTAVSLGELRRLKSLFGASIQAITYRCRDLGIIPEPLFRELFQSFKDRGWRSPPYEELGALPVEEPNRFERLCFRAMAEDALSEARVAELLGVSVRELNCRMNGEEAPCSDKQGHLRGVAA